MGIDHSNSPPSHFKGKDAISHVAEAQAQGVMAAAEIHGAEISGKASAAADALRDCSLYLLLTWEILNHSNIDPSIRLFLFIIVGICLLIWKAGRSAWLGWSRLERLHRILAQEKWEIEHHRQQERDELRVIYAAKGFEGKLLEDVLDVLMADGNRLLKVMAEEELGLSLESTEHPLVQSFGALMGTLGAVLLSIIGIYINVQWGALGAAILGISIGAFLTALHLRNRLIPAVIWNLGLLALAYGTFYFLIVYLFSIL